MFIEELKEKLITMAGEMDKSKCISTDLLSWMYEEKLFKLFVPEEWGGKMLDLPDALKVFEEVSKMEGNLGWLTAIGSGGGMFVPLIHKETAERLFKEEKAVLAGSGYPRGTAVKTDNGYRVTGEWKYCSGAEFASFFTANSIKENGEVTSFIFMPDQVEVIRDWDAFGLRATGSHTIRVQDAFVPEERTFHLTQTKNEYGGAVHTFPFVPFSQASFTAVCLGIASHFFEEAKNMAAGRLESGDGRFEKVIEAVCEKEKMLKKRIDDFYGEIGELWSAHAEGKSITEDQETHFGETCKRSVEEAIMGAGSLIRLLGMEAIMESSAINKIWRDLYTAGQHAFLTH